MSGDDGTAVALMLLGGHGNVSVTANVAPRAMHELCMAAIEGRSREASAIQFKLLSLHRSLFVESSPAPTKWAMARLKLCGDALRLPITPLTAAGQAGQLCPHDAHVESAPLHLDQPESDQGVSRERVELQLSLERRFSTIDFAHGKKNKPGREQDLR